MFLITLCLGIRQVHISKIIVSNFILPANIHLDTSTCVVIQKVHYIVLWCLNYIKLTHESIEDVGNCIIFHFHLYRLVGELGVFL